MVSWRLSKLSNGAGESFMKSKEDREFEEWARKKKIASGVDPDEDFASGRKAEGGIYAVGGACARVRHCLTR